MVKSKKIALKLSETRQELAQLNAKDELGDNDRERMAELSAKYAELETEYRAALIVEDADEAENAETERRTGDGGEATGLRALYEGAELGAYLRAAADGSPLDGREAELSQELNLGAGIVVPWEVLDDRDAAESAETRADANAAPPATTSVNQRNIMGRVFARTSASWLGVAMPSVAPGRENYPVFSTGVEAETVAKGASTDTAAATFTPNLVGPSRLQARYRFAIEDAAVFRGMESALRMDMREALGIALDKDIIANGFLGAGGLANPADPSSVAVWDDAAKAAIERPDGVYAHGTESCKFLLGQATYQHLALLFRDESDAGPTESGLDYLRRLAGGVRLSAHIPAASSNIQTCIATLGMEAGAAVGPVWQGVRIIRDEISRAGEGEVTLTCTMLRGFAITRAARYKRLEFKLA